MKTLSFIILCLIMCSCTVKVRNDKDKKSDRPKKQYTFNTAYDYDHIRHVHQADMHFVIIYYEGVHVVNITKDSLEVSLLKKQATRDSLQILVFRKYLKK